MRTLPNSARARRALDVLERLQHGLARRLEQAAASLGHSVRTEPVEWLRDEGAHGGGVRLVAADGEVYDRASCNLSGVHYDDLPDKRLASANALSCIVHPAPPLAPSMHLHMSFTELRDGRGTFRLMADLNPSNPRDWQTERFEATLREEAGDLYEAGAAQGAKYFWIPALQRHRGVSHFYLEGHDSGDFDADLSLVHRLTTAVIGTYGELVEQGGARPATEAHAEAQRAYHTLYLFQVLTLDRGTTSGLLVHDQNDLGIMGSLPSRVDPELLASWEAKVPDIQRPLVRGLVEALGDGAVDAPTRLKLASTVRTFYEAHPEALALQARGDVVPPTVANHR